MDVAEDNPAALVVGMAVAGDSPAALVAADKAVAEDNPAASAVADNAVAADNPAASAVGMSVAAEDNPAALVVAGLPVGVLILLILFLSRKCHKIILLQKLGFRNLGNYSYL